MKPGALSEFYPEYKGIMELLFPGNRSLHSDLSIINAPLFIPKYAYLHFL